MVPVQQQPPCVAGERGPVNLFLTQGKKFKKRFATLEASGGTLYLCIAEKAGATAKGLRGANAIGS